MTSQPTRRHFEFYLHLNWKTGAVKAYMRQPRIAATGYTVPIVVRIDLVIPRSTPVIEAQVVLSDKRVNNIVVEEL